MSSPKTHGLIITCLLSEKNNEAIPKNVPTGGRTERPFRPVPGSKQLDKKPSFFPTDIIYED